MRWTSLVGLFLVVGLIDASDKGREGLTTPKNNKREDSSDEDDPGHRIVDAAQIHPEERSIMTHFRIFFLIKSYFDLLNENDYG